MTPFPLVDLSCPQLDDVVSCVAQVLGIEEGEVEPDARLTELGLESFTAVRLRRRLRECVGADLPIASFLGEASARSIAQRISPDGAGFPLTAAQSAYWVGRDPAFPLGGVATFFFHEYDRHSGDQDADLDRLEQAWNMLVEHHPMLRMVVGDDGRQRILPSPGPYLITRTDLRDASVEEAQQELARLRAERARRYVRDFAIMMRDLRGERLAVRIEEVCGGGLPALAQYAAGLAFDLDAVTAGLSVPWSSGQAEGQNTRVKLIERQGYGRANFDLLRKKILLRD